MMECRHCRPGGAPERGGSGAGGHRSKLHSCLSTHGAGVVAVVVMTSGEVTQRLFEREKVARIQIVTSEFNLERS